MKFFVIPPVNFMRLSQYNGQKTAFALAHLCMPTVTANYQQYRDFFKARVKEGYHVILDNSAAEGSLVTEDILIDLVREIKPTEVIAPDVLFNKDATLSNLQHFIERMHRQGLLKHTKIFAVVQGSNRKEFLDCYEIMRKNIHINCIGFSKLTVPYCFSKTTRSQSIAVNRNYLINKLNKEGKLSKDIHCLGMREIWEFKAYKNIPQIRSTDSCYTCLAGYRLQRLSLDDKTKIKDGTPHDYFFYNLNRIQYDKCEQNIEEMMRATK